MAGLIQLSNVRVTRDEKPVLDDLDLTLYERERLAIIGANGAGKTTLLRTLVGLEQVHDGQICLFGHVCRNEADFRKQRQRIGFLFQESDDQLFCPTVIDDVAFGPCNLGATDDEARKQAMEMLQKLGIAHLAQRFTHHLSGGEKRLVCLAGLLAMQPDVLLLDEPTNGVDAVNNQCLRAALEAFEGSILLVSHDEPFVAEFSTRVLALASGQLQIAEVHEHRHVHNHPHIHVKGDS